MQQVFIVRLPHGEDLPLPAYATEHSAGMDLYAAIPSDASEFLRPGERALIPCGFRMALPVGFEAQVRPRSGLAFKYGVTILNSPGTIDADYRGEVKVILVNLGHVPFRIDRGDRIAQMVIARHEHIQWHLVSDLEDTERGHGGFGHTGL